MWGIKWGIKRGRNPQYLQWLNKFMVQLYSFLWGITNKLYVIITGSIANLGEACYLRKIIRKRFMKNKGDFYIGRVIRIY